MAGWGRISSAALLASGIAGIVTPTKFSAALDLPAISSRGTAETRAGLGGTYAGLGGWAFLRGDAAADRAIGVTWLGAGLVRIAALAIDRPDTDWTYWAYLAGELTLGTLSLASARAAIGR